MSLYRRQNYTNIIGVCEFIHAQLRQSGRMHGYRLMHLKCIQHGLIVQKESVHELLRTLDPQGLEIRCRRRLLRRQYATRGSNHLWLIDSYDKLTPHGVCINGCIDGFSRQIMWLEAGKTNSDPHVIAGYFIRTILSKNGTPTYIRSDMGTENIIVAQMQLFLREKGYIYGTSQHNQRIDTWWGILRRKNAQFWMSLFADIKSDGYFSGG